ncbi:ferredoxin--NADP reductase [Mycolicibacter sinensis]|uniref:3-ketosteroid-9-alpha-hydroxylase n=1 Tax=Mycolicibacter sinensis (strain JDM601) TaxID=875328 RepID=A0A1A3TRF6_MYCSD|nr:ferredoxin--NADP reductase [Mycolicibacter sinensis]OBK85244.1 3-ketosteroid-9-alpha-hydroxylase [Mycolicibacter sinensis]
MNARAHDLRIFEVVKETAEAVTLIFDVPDELTDRFGYAPGQFLTVRVPSGRDGSVARCYSLCSSPHCDERMAVTVKRTPDGYASNWICDNVAVDSVLTVLEPSGAFVPRSLGDDVLLCAAGSGITPIMSIAKSVLVAGAGHVTLVYANRDSDSVIFDRQLRELAEKFPARLHVAHWLVEHRGMPTAAGIAELVAPYTGREVYLCGPAAFAAATTDALRGLGVSADRIHLEEYRSLDSNPFVAPAAEPAPGGAAGGPVVHVEFDGDTYDFDWPDQTPLLDVLLAAGLDIPYVCRESACGTCVCSVKSGRTRMRQNESLIDEELERGLTLACQTLPESDRVHVAFDQ